MRVVTADEFRMFPANGKQQTAELNSAAKFPRAELLSRPLSDPPRCHALSLSVLSLSGSSLSLCLSCPLHPPQSDRTLVQRGGGCGVAHIRV